MNAPPLGSPNSFRSTRPLPPNARGHHRRNSSQSSVASNLSSASAPTATMEALMRTIQSAPKGSKMAEDAAKALLLAERARFKATGVPLERPFPGAARSPGPAPQIPLPPTPDAPSYQLPAFQPIVAGSPQELIGNAFIGNTPTIEEEDPFDLSAYLDDGASDNGSVGGRYLRDAERGMAGPSDWAGAPPYPPGTRLETISRPLTPAHHKRHNREHLSPGGKDVMIGTGAPPMEREDSSNYQGEPLTNSAGPTRNRSQHVRPRINVFADIPAQQNALAIFWRGENTQDFTLITDGVGQQGADDPFPLQVEGRNTQVIEVPERWSGRVQKVTGALSDPATRCDITFDGFKGFNFFGVSYAWGNNGPVVIRSSPNNAQAGSPFRAPDVAPSEITRQDASGRRVVIGTQNTLPHYGQVVRKFYRDFFEHGEQGAILANDNSATVATRDRHLLLDFY